jgi:hypothetical protein
MVNGALTVAPHKGIYVQKRIVKDVPKPLLNVMRKQSIGQRKILSLLDRYL